MKKNRDLNWDWQTWGLAAVAVVLLCAAKWIMGS